MFKFCREPEAHRIQAIIQETLIIWGFRLILGVFLCTRVLAVASGENSSCVYQVNIAPDIWSVSSIRREGFPFRSSGVLRPGKVST